MDEMLSITKGELSSQGFTFTHDDKTITAILDNIKITIAQLDVEEFEVKYWRDDVELNSVWFTDLCQLEETLQEALDEIFGTEEEDDE